MKKFLLSFVLMTLACNLFALNPDSLQVKIDSLENRVTELERRVAYNELDNSLKLFMNEITLEATGISGKASDVSLNRYQRVLVRDLYTAFLENFRATVEKRESYDGLLVAYYMKAAAWKMAYNFNDTEWDVIRKEFDSIGQALNHLDSSIRLYKSSLDVYREALY